MPWAGSASAGGPWGGTCAGATCTGAGACALPALRRCTSVARAASCRCRSSSTAIIARVSASTAVRTIATMHRLLMRRLPLKDLAGTGVPPCGDALLHPCVLPCAGALPPKLAVGAPLQADVLPLLPLRCALLALPANPPRGTPQCAGAGPLLPLPSAGALQ